MKESLIICASFLILCATQVITDKVPGVEQGLTDFEKDVELQVSKLDHGDMTEEVEVKVEATLVREDPLKTGGGIHRHPRWRANRKLHRHHGRKPGFHRASRYGNKSNSSNNNPQPVWRRNRPGIHKVSRYTSRNSSAIKPVLSRGFARPGNHQASRHMRGNITTNQQVPLRRFHRPGSHRTAWFINANNSNIKVIPSRHSNRLGIHKAFARFFVTNNISDIEPLPSRQLNRLGSHKVPATFNRSNDSVIRVKPSRRFHRPGNWNRNHHRQRYRNHASATRWNRTMIHLTQNRTTHVNRRTSFLHLRAICNKLNYPLRGQSFNKFLPQLNQQEMTLWKAIFLRKKNDLKRCCKLTSVPKKLACAEDLKKQNFSANPLPQIRPRPDPRCQGRKLGRVQQACCQRKGPARNQCFLHKRRQVKME